MFRIVVLYPTRERAPASIEKLGREIAMLSGRHHVRFIVGLDSDDPTLLEAMSAMRVVHEAAHRKGAYVEVRIGVSEGKVHATNRLSPHPDSYDVLIVHSDDMHIGSESWDAVAAVPLMQRFPDGDVAALCHDGIRTDLITWPVLGSWFVRTLPWNTHAFCATPYDPRYRSVCCDDALTEVAILRRRMHIGSPSLVTHAHPAWHGREADALDARNIEDERDDRGTLRIARTRGFGCKPPMLSILTPTIPGREASLQRLRARLDDERRGLELDSDVEWVVRHGPHRADGGETIGCKREALLRSALGEWVWFIDDDDTIAPGSLRRVVDALRDNDPDVVGFDLLYRGDVAGEWKRYRHRHGMAWVDSPITIDAIAMCGTRPVNHVNPVRRSIAMAIGFGVNRNQQEDCDFAGRLASSGRVHRDVFLDGDPVYLYETPSDPERRWHELHAVEKEKTP
jgi:hypothetical protein